MRATNVYILDSHSIYRMGMASCLERHPAVSSVSGADSVAAARADRALAEADLVMVDTTLAGAHDFMRELRERETVCVIACATHWEEAQLLAAAEAGAVGMLDKDSLTPEGLGAGVQAALNGAGVMPTELLGSLLRSLNRVSRDVLEPRGLSLSRLTARELDVLRLIADGHATREVAQELCYSERTVKSVLHDVVTKLGARSRSHAVAYAVREGLI